jgi:site-specific recombinase XerD
VSRVLTQGTFDWDRAVRGFLTSRRAQNCSPETLRFYEENLARFRAWLSERYPDLGPLDVRAGTVREFFDWLLSTPVRFSGSTPPARRPISAHGAHRYYRTLRAFYRWLEQEVGAFLEGWVSPMTGIRAPKLPTRPVPTLTQEQVKRLVEVTQKQGRNRERNLAILYILLDKGLRASELLGLTLDDWDWATGTLTIRGKGRKIRQVVLHPTANRALKAYVWTARPESDSDRIFLTEEGKPLEYQGLRTLLARLGEAAGIDLHPHLLRHTFAISWVTAGGSLHELQALLGHSSPTMSLQYGRMVSDRVDPDRQARFSPIAGLERPRHPRQR